MSDSPEIIPEPEPEFEPGDRVVDEKDDPDRQTPMRVVEHHSHAARNHFIGDLGASVYLLNQDYSPEATVVDVVYEPTLDDELGDDDTPLEKTAMIARYYDLRTYSFPAPRLQRIEEDGKEVVEA